MSPKKQYKPRVWSKYNKSKVLAGNIFVHFSDDIEEWWYEGKKNGKQGRDKTYSDQTIEFSLLVYTLLMRKLRQTQGFIQGMLDLLQLKLTAPDYSTISRRSLKLDIPYRMLKPTDDLHIFVDSTGVSIHVGNSYWNEYKHRKTDQKKWLKIHVCVNVKTGEVLANTLTDPCTSDSSQVEPLLKQLPDQLEKFYGDTAYDRDQVYDAIKAHQSMPVDIVIPPIATSSIPDEQNNLTQRQKHILYINDKGRHRWDAKNKYGQRQKTEGVFARLKSTFGERLLSRDSCAQKTEISLKFKFLNKMNELYTDGYVR